METMQPSSEVMSVKQLSQKYTFKSEAGWRWTIFNADLNGFSRAIRKVGGRVVVLEPELLV